MNRIHLSRLLIQIEDRLVEMDAILQILLYTRKLEWAKNSPFQPHNSVMLARKHLASMFCSKVILRAKQ